MARAPKDRFRQQMAVFFKLPRGDIPQRANPRQNFGKHAHRFLAIRAPRIIFVGRQFVPDHGIADDQRHCGGTGSMRISSERQSSSNA